MSELVAEVKMLSVYMKCDNCGAGLMEYDISKRTLLTNPPQYPHKCNNCGHTENFEVKYPYQKLIPIENLREPTESEKV